MNIGIFGAGSVGCFVGGMLASAGRRPILVGRETVAQRLAGGMTLSRHDSMQRRAEAGAFVFATQPQALGGCDVVLVCVKSGDTEAAGRALAPVLGGGAVVVSLQNGISNGRVLREVITGHPVLRGMVGFNVVQVGPERFHCGTEGEIVLEHDPRTVELSRVLLAAGVPAATSAQIEAVQWGKLLLNLNNPVNALSGLPLKRQLAQRAYRRVVAGAAREALVAMRAAGIRPARVGRVPPRLVPAILELPDALFQRIAAGMLRIDDDARSSMAEDIERGRMPEVDWLNGEIVALGHAHGVRTPVNERLVALVKAAFGRGTAPALSGQALLEQTGID